MTSLGQGSPHGSPARRAPDLPIDFSVGGVVLALQPFSLRLVYPRPHIAPTVVGRRLAGRKFGYRVVVTWGEQFATLAEVAMIREVFPPSPLTIAWTEPTGEAFTFRVVRERIQTQWDWARPGFYEPTILTFEERPPVHGI